MELATKGVKTVVRGDSKLGNKRFISASKMALDNMHELTNEFGAAGLMVLIAPNEGGNGQTAAVGVHGNSAQLMYAAIKSIAEDMPKEHRTAFCATVSHAAFMASMAPVVAKVVQKAATKPVKKATAKKTKKA